MAGIEKVCEYSGEHSGWKMYEYKHNLIQVMPMYRPLFKGQEHTLYIWPTDLHFVHKWGGSQSAHTKETFIAEELKWTGKKPKGKFAQQYYFSLHVPALSGNVNGFYLNHTMDIKAVRHKIRKLLGLNSVRDLNIKKLQSMEQYFKDIRKD